jgi:hypothetical protein
LTVAADVVALEEEGWRALSTGAAAARSFYERVLDDDVVLLFPGGMAISGRDGALASMGAAPWSRFELHDVAVRELGAGGAIVSYRAVAERPGQGTYEALVSSGYRRHDGGWRLCFHQQTPI